jgi:membrane protease YdiL (CAAX protease family)
MTPETETPAETDVGPGTERDYATLGRRALAALLDNAVWLMAYFWFFGAIVAALYDESVEAGSIALLVYFSLWFNYFAFCEWRWGQTIGKNATRIMVVSDDGGRLTFGQASMRGLLRLIDWLVIGWLMIATGKRHQRLGDRVAKTLVVERPSRTGSTMVKAPELAARQIAGGAPSPPAVPAPPPPPPPGEPGRPNEKRPGIRGRLPEITWSLKDTVWGLVAGLILAVLSPIIVVPFDPDLDSDWSLLAAQGIFGLCLLAVPLGIASGWSRSNLGLARVRLGLRSFPLQGLGWMLLVLVVYYVFAGLFAEFVLNPEQDDIADELGLNDENVLVALVAVALIAVLAPIAEEMFFRGFVFSGLRSRMTLWPAALISGLVFGLVHAPTGITTVIPLAVLGVALAWLYDKTGSLWPPILAHAINNGLALAYLASEGMLPGL